MTDKTRGLYQKFNVTRTDGSSAPGGKHANCEYFVLDLTHDKHAAAAIRAYADSCVKEFPALASDLRKKVGMRPPVNGCLQYFVAEGVSRPEYVPKKTFDMHVRKKHFIDGPYRDGFGDGHGEPYNEKRQAYGRIRVSKIEHAIYTEMSEDGK